MTSDKIYKLPVARQLSLFEADEKEEGIKATRPSINERTYRIVGDEVLNGKFDPETWAKALASGSRTREAALSVYAQLRSEELSEENALLSAKQSALEERKRLAALGTYERRRPLSRRDFSIVRDFYFWQILLSISGIGLYLTLLAMQDGRVWWPGWLPILTLSFFLQLSPAVFYGIGRMLLGPIKYHRALGFTSLVIIGLGSLGGTATFRGERLPNWLRVKTISANTIAQSPSQGAGTILPSTNEQEF